MAPKKRALEQSDANVQPTRVPKQQKRDEPPRDAEIQEQSEAEHSKETQCVNQPSWDRPKDVEDQDEDEDDEDDEGNESAPQIKMHLKPAAEHPEWKWTMMWKSWQMLCDFSVREKYTEPDFFHMYIYNDFHGYGMMELAENAVADFNNEFKKKDGSLHLMWAPLAMLGRWLCNDTIEEMMIVDDGERMFQMIKLIGYAFLTALHAIDRAGKLTKDSEFRDLGLVMTLHLQWSHGFGADDDDDEAESWREHVVSYAKKAGIDLKTVGCASMEMELADVEDTEPLDQSTKSDRWEWNKIFKKYASEHGKKGNIGGQKYDITKMSSRERASYNFDKKDPLKDVPADVLKENRLDFGSG